METTENQLAAELVRDYLEHFKLDYTLSIYLPESGLKEQPSDRNETAWKAGISASDEPLLVSLLKWKPSADPLSLTGGKSKLDPLPQPAKKGLDPIP